MKKIAVMTVALAFAAGCSQPPAPRGTAITNVTVIDAVNGVRERQTVIFDGDEIISVAPTSDEDPAAVQTIDGSGQFLIPGLWDMHVHLTYDDAVTGLMPRSFLYYGVTSVRDTGGLMRKMKPVVDRMREPGAVSPRVFYAGPLLDGRFVVYDGKSRPEIGTSNATVAAARRNVAALKEQGVDFIKIYELVSPDVYDALVQAANENGLPIASHVPLSLRASQAGPYANSMEHLRNVEMDCASNAGELHETRRQVLSSYEPGSGYELRSSLHKLQRLAAIAMHDEERCLEVLAALRSTIQVPTTRLLTLGLQKPDARDDWDEAFGKMPDGVRESWQAELANADIAGITADIRYDNWALEMISRMHAQGVPIGAGTDTPIGFAIPGYSLLNELDLLVRAGLPPIEALRSATIRPAEFLGLEDEMGTIAAGMKADLVLLDANPLDDINNTRRIDRVVSKGVVFLRSELDGTGPDGEHDP